MAPGPDGGLYVLIDTPRGLVTGPPSQAVLALLDAAGKPRSGWPIKLTGWSCKDQNGPTRVMATAADGSIRLVCVEDADGEVTARQFALAFDPAGQELPGWPVELPVVDIWGSPPQTVGDELLVLAHAFAESLGGDIPQPGAWWLISVAADGTVRQGARYEVPDLAPYLSGASGRIAADGSAYLLAVRGALDAVTTQVVALDVNGVRTGWPQTVNGLVSSPTIGPQGRVYFVRTQGAGAATHSQRLVFERDGRAVGVASDVPRMAAELEYTGAGAGLAAPTVAADGTSFISGEIDGRAAAYAIDPSGRPLPGWPYRPDARFQRQGACSAQDTGCGVWRAVPAVGPNDTLYLLVAAPDSRHGGSIVAIGIDGHVRAGWPVRLPAGAGFWSALVRPDGTVQALAVARKAGRDSWTLYLIDPDGTVRQRTPIVKP